MFELRMHSPTERLPSPRRRAERADSGSRIGQGVLPAAAWVAAGLLVAACGSASAPPGSNSGDSWGTPVQVEPPPPVALYGVSCVTSKWCVAVDENGSAIRWESGTWSSPVHVPAGGTLTSVSCSSTSHCVAVSAGGRASTFDGTSWSSGRTIGPESSYEISCPTATFCAAVGAPGVPEARSTVTTFDGTTWSTANVPSGGSLLNRVLGVSCSSASFCVAVNFAGSVLVFDGARWTSTAAEVPHGLWAISCPASTFCMALTATAFTTFDGVVWKPPAPIPGLTGALLRSVSCSSHVQCTVVGLDGSGATWRGGTWTHRSTIFPGGITATVVVSCAKSGGCVAVNSKGLASSN